MKSESDRFTDTNDDWMDTFGIPVKTKTSKLNPKTIKRIKSLLEKQPKQ